MVGYFMNLYITYNKMQVILVYVCSERESLRFLPPPVVHGGSIASYINPHITNTPHTRLSITFGYYLCTYISKYVCMCMYRTSMCI